MATIVCSAEKVKEAAEKVIAHILEKRKEYDEKAIANIMARPRKFFWTRKPNPYTREEAINFLNKSDFFGWQSQYAWGDLEHARKLLLIAEHGDPVTLNENDARVLFA